MIAASCCIRLGIALVLLVAGAQKALDVAAFRATIADYATLPRRWAPGLAWSVVVAELILGVLLLVGYEPRLGLIVAAALFALFSLVVSHEVRRGSEVECGCFGGGTGTISWHLVARDLLLAGAALAASAFEPLSGGDVSFGSSSWLACAVTAASLLIAYATTAAGLHVLQRRPQ